MTLSSRVWLPMLLACGCSSPAERWIDRFALADQAQMDPMQEPPDDETRERDALAGREEVVKLGIAAFPALIAHLEDRRPSVYGGAILNYPTVGFVCAKLIAEAVDPLLPKGVRVIYSYICVWDGTVSLWWRGRESRSLRELQIESRLFGLVSAERDGDGEYVRFFTAELRSLGVENIDAGPFRKLARMLDLPRTVEEQVASLACDATTYPERRFQRERFVRLWANLLDRPDEALPHLVRAMETASLAGPAFEILQSIIEPIAMDLCPRFAFLSPERVPAWWKERAGRPVKDLVREATRHHLRLAETAAFRTPADRANALKWLRKPLDD